MENVNKHDESLEALCRYFSDELARQEEVLNLTIAQGNAAQARDMSALDAKTIALQGLIQQVVGAEKQRLQLLHTVVEEYALPKEAQTLSHLIEVVPEPFQSRLRDFQKKMQTILKEIQHVVRENNRKMRYSLRIVDHALHAVTPHTPVSRGYNASGADAVVRSAVPTMVDQRG